MQNTVERFDGRASDYSRYRERYNADELLAPLRDWCAFTPDWLVADVGAGTGMLADVFLANGNRVIAIEPNAEMRAACARLHVSDSRLEVREGTAEVTGLLDASIDLVCCGRALHWFDLDAAMREFRRVLRPGGWVVSVTGGRADLGRQENVAFEKLIERFTESPGYRQAAYSAYSRMKDFFQDGEFHHHEHGGEMCMDWEQVHGMAHSLSRAPRPDNPRFAEFERELRSFFDRYAKSGVVTWETRCWLNAGRF